MTSHVVSVLTADWLRDRLSGDFAASLPPDGWFGETLLGHNAELLPAAVLIPIVIRATGLTVLLTQRTSHLRDHAGQVSFPGGRSEPRDLTPAATALREAEEEVGLDPGQVEVLGTLNRYQTGTGFTITPVVGLVTPPLDLKLDDFEVADVFEPPLSFLLDPANFRRDRVEARGAVHEYWAVPWQERYIWGATAGMLVNLRRCLLGDE
ncbi:MAG: CoA pyrophosphatase [Rhodocyclaceae bacterium]|jgi:8-oxo-dGTP pyrophosphatase MutT (NUDIX family)|nr:CoA pyrophosphatase [Rhodocyclaceae bacterium]MBK6552758.1 CoA pyrophosphatase [Rhodocyclaceae bacterium]MBK7814964.1 CoA pyrophosphatase [Rhodocyclaceae bacterium]MBK9312290.1 CoA pyrophosphatase [Rhodocyclaceae bacterium]MBK9956052.1 CoA pyrophosphatase [Rhodocyclaceae bacterium]